MEQWVNQIFLWIGKSPQGVGWALGLVGFTNILVWILIFFVGRATVRRVDLPAGANPSVYPESILAKSADDTTELVRLFILISDLARKLTNHHQTEAIARELLGQVKQLFPHATEIGLFFPNTDGSEAERTLQLKLGSGIAREASAMVPIPYGAGLIGLAASQGMILWEQELEDRFGRQKATQDQEFGYYRADVAVPIILNQFLMAVLTVKGIATGGAGSQEQRTLSIISQIAAVSFGYADKVTSLDSTNKKLGRLAEDLSDLNQNLQIKVEEKVSALRKAEHDLMQAEHLALFGEFVASVAHDIKTPMAFISGESQWALELMKEGGQDRQGLLNSLEIIQKNAMRLQNDVKTLLSKVKVPEMRRENESIVKILGEILSMIRHSAEKKGIVLSGNVMELCKQGEKAHGAYTLECYPGLLRHVFTNLVSNALDVMKGPGSLKITLASGAKGLEVTVADSGPGIPESEIPHLFDLFYSKKKGGLGIGLNSVKRIVEKNHGGKVSVISRPDQGTEFKILLPTVAVEI